MAKKSLNILILAGGDSTERAVSLSSAASVFQSLQNSGYKVRALDIPGGQILTDQSGRFIEGKDKKLLNNQPLNIIKISNVIKDSGVDLVFNALHGGTGENGRIQSLLDFIGIPYTGSPMTASALAMDKNITKRVMQSLAIPTAEWLKFDSAAKIVAPALTAEIEKKILPMLEAGPVIIKPNDGGSTVGLSLVEGADQIAPAIQDAFLVSDSILTEKYLKGREVAIAVLDRQPLPPVEIRPNHKLYDYTCKYTKGKSEYICPAELDPDIVKRLSDDSVRLYDQIGCRGYARVDFILADDGRYICLELNTLPGMTELSLFPMAAREFGLPFDQLLEKICLLALEGR